MKRLADTFFYGNFFVGLCAVALCIETNVQHRYPLNDVLFYCMAGLAVTWYYTSLYITDIPAVDLNERVTWYRRNQRVMLVVQRLTLLLLVVISIAYVIKHAKGFAGLGVVHYVQLSLFPLVALAYTYHLIPFLNVKKLRRIGWLKPFIIGFVWSGIVSVYPVFCLQIESHQTGHFFHLPSFWLWLKNLMFISTLCIMFDIKDYESDREHQLKTYAVQFGINNTIRYIIIPLVLAGMTSFFMFTVSHHFPAERILLNAIPYILLLICSYTLHKKHSIIYYLFVIDGLMIIKAIFGTASILLLK